MKNDIGAFVKRGTYCLQKVWHDQVDLYACDENGIWNTAVRQVSVHVARKLGFSADEIFSVF